MKCWNCLGSCEKHWKASTCKARACVKSEGKHQVQHVCVSLCAESIAEVEGEEKRSLKTGGSELPGEDRNRTSEVITSEGFHLA